MSAYRWLVLIVVTLAVSACQAADRVIGPPTEARFLDGCEDTRPQQDQSSGDPLPVDCDELDVQDATAQMTQLGAIHISNETYSPSFSGQSFSFDDVVNSSGFYSACPDVLENVRFHKIVDGSIQTFQTVGLAFRSGPPEPRSDGISQARYNLPSDVVYSNSGDYYAFSGSVTVVCGRTSFQFNYGNIFGHIDASGWLIYNYTGTINRSGVSGSGPTSGWTYYESASGFANGNNHGWADALNMYLGGGGGAGGQCSPNWDIMVDGKFVCKNGEPVNQS